MEEAVQAAKAVIDLGVYELHRDASDDPYANYLGITQVDWNKELIWTTGYASRAIIARRTTPTGVKTKKGGNGAAYGALGPYATTGGCVMRWIMVSIRLLDTR